jgi:predicted RNA-binding Zn-ribbon protein involved in translation (DUF1610 family)
MCLIAPSVEPVLDGVGVALGPAEVVALGVGVAVAPGFAVGVAVGPGVEPLGVAVAEPLGVALVALAGLDALAEGIGVGVPAGNCGTVVVLLPHPAAVATSSEKRTQHVPREIERVVITNLPECGTASIPRAKTRRQQGVRAVSNDTGSATRRNLRPD